MTNVKINFSTDRIKYLLYEMAKTCVFDNNGVIFGGYARDMIISDHYKTLYNSNNKGYSTHKFWNQYYQPETAARTLVAKDMDICMYSLRELETFVTSLKHLLNDRVGYENVLISEISVSQDNIYFNMPVITHRHIEVKVTVGKIPFVHSGINIVLNFDIVVPRKAKLQPPFNRLDLLSNVFLLTKQGIVLSSNTGTIIDQMSILNKKKITGLIMSDIVEFKTQFCKQNFTSNYDSGCFSYNMKVIERLNKMLFRSFPWEITNLPFELESFKHVNDTDCICCICHSNFKYKEATVNMYSYNSTKTEKICTMTHSRCLFKYFDTQIENARADMLPGAEAFQFRCPMRNDINFNKYAGNINEIISEKLSGKGGSQEANLGKAV